MWCVLGAKETKQKNKNPDLFYRRAKPVNIKTNIYYISEDNLCYGKKYKVLLTY